MPEYCFSCECGHKFSVRRPMGSAAGQCCGRCGDPAQRDYRAETKVCITEHAPYRAPQSASDGKPLAQSVRDGDYKLYQEAGDTGMLG